MSFQSSHLKRFTTLLRITRTNIGTVTTTQTVKNVYLNTELHSFELFTCCFQ